MPPKDAAPQGTPSGGGGGDRLSVLRDATLIRILSHLKAWEAVRSCVLSKRWRGLWASAAATTRRLDIRQPCGCGMGLGAAARRRRADAFAAFVKNLLLRRHALQPLDALRLCWSHDARDGDANIWIAHAVRHGAKEIELSGKHHAVFPSLEYMSFIAGGGIDIRFKILKLIHVRLDDATLTELGSRCTTLEELELTDCLLPQAAKIRSTLLKRLTMIKCQIPRGLLVYAPNLVSLRCSRTFEYVPWIENMGPQYCECLGLGSCNLQILKLSHVQLDDATLRQLCFWCTSLQELELKDCSVELKEIRSTSLKYLTMISCKFAIGFRVHAPNLVLLRCIKPVQYVPCIENMRLLVTATVVLDDFCLRDDHQWPQEEDDKDESDRDGDFFAHAGTKVSDNNNDNKCDPQYDDTEDYYDPGWSAPAIDHSVGYSVIANEYKGKPSWYFRQEHNHSEDDPGDDCGERLGADGMLCSLSNVRTMDLLAHSGEVLLRRELKSCPDLKNLKTLSLGEWCITPNFDSLATMLLHSPNIGNLFLHLDMVCNRRQDITPGGSSFMCRNLKMVKITCSMHDVMVHKMAEFLSASSIPHQKIIVRQTACTGNSKGGTVPKAKRNVNLKREQQSREKRDN